MKAICTILLLSALVLAVSSCSHGYYTRYSGPYGYTRVYEGTRSPAVYISPPSAGYSRIYDGAGYHTITPPAAAGGSCELSVTLLTPNLSIT